MSDVNSPDPAATGTEEAQPGGKVSLMDKVKAKAKVGTKKLKSKLNKGGDSTTPTGGAEQEDSSSASSSDEEAEQDAPVKNAITGMTQPEYGKKLEEGDQSVLEDSTAATEGSPSVPSTNFPGDFEGTVGEKETELSRDFQGLSTKEKGSAPESESTGSEKPITEKASGALFGAKEQVEEKVGSDKPSGGESVTDSLPEQVKPTEETKQAAAGYYEKASGVATDYYNIAAEKASQYTGKTQETAKDFSESGSTEEVADKAANAGKSWSEWAAEKVGYGKDVAAEKLPTTEDGTSAPDAAIGKATEAKDVISQKTGEAANTASAKAEETTT